MTEYSAMIHEFGLARSGNGAMVPVRAEQGGRSPPMSFTSAPELTGEELGGMDRFMTAAPCTVVIEPRSFFRDCVLSSLASVAPSAHLQAFETVEEWAASDVVARSELVILWQDDGNPGAMDEIEKRVVDVRNVCPEAPLALMSQHEDLEFVQRVMKAGANAFIPTSLGFQATLRVFDLVRAGGTFIPASCLTHAAPTQAPQAPGSAELQGLFSPKQLAVARALRKGMPNKLIAYELNMCESTVKVHVRTIMKKLKARNRTEVAFLTQSLGAAG